MQKGTFFASFLYKGAERKGLIINNYSRKYPNLKIFSKVKFRNPNETRKTQT